MSKPRIKHLKANVKLKVSINKERPKGLHLDLNLLKLSIPFNNNKGYFGHHFINNKSCTFLQRLKIR